MNKVTQEHINSLLERVQYKHQVIGTSTFVYAFLDDKFYLAVGHSACVDPASFDFEIGKDLALKDVAGKVVAKLWELEGYRLYESLRSTE